MRDERPIQRPASPRQTNSVVVRCLSSPCPDHRLGSHVDPEGKGKRGEGIDKWRAKEQRNLADSALTYCNKLLRIVVVVVAARGERWWRRWEGDGSIEGGGFCPRFNPSRSVYLLISSGLERRIATPCLDVFLLLESFLIWGGEGRCVPTTLEENN